MNNYYRIFFGGIFTRRKLFWIVGFWLWFFVLLAFLKEDFQRMFGTRTENIGSVTVSFSLFPSFHDWTERIHRQTDTRTHARTNTHTHTHTKVPRTSTGFCRTWRQPLRGVSQCGCVHLHTVWVSLFIFTQTGCALISARCITPSDSQLSVSHTLHVHHGRCLDSSRSGRVSPSPVCPPACCFGRHIAPNFNAKHSIACIPVYRMEYFNKSTHVCLSLLLWVFLSFVQWNSV